MLLLRCPSRSFTIVGDRAQARHGFTESWQERLERVGLDRITLASLTHQLPDAGGGHGARPSRSSGPRCRTPTCRRPSAAAASPSCTAPPPTWTRSSSAWLAEHAEGIACVIGDPGVPRRRSRVRSLTPELAKGLEFDLVVLVDPRGVRRGHRGGGRPLRRDDPGDPAARRPHQPVPLTSPSVRGNLRFVATYEAVLDALGDRTRRQIVEVLRGGPETVGDIAERVGVSRPAVSAAPAGAAGVPARRLHVGRDPARVPGRPGRHPGPAELARRLLGRRARPVRAYAAEDAAKDRPSSPPLGKG